MNIVFEGITGVGKTTIINKLTDKMILNNIEVYKVSEIDSVSPLSCVLTKMVEKDTFLRMKEDISTIITESLILAADYQYMKEYTKKISGYKIFDRDIFTQIVYQKYFLEKEYGKNNDFFENWEKCITFDKKLIDKVIYVDAPFELCVKRNEIRDKRKWTEEDRHVLKDLSLLQKEYVINFCNKEKIDLLFIDGSLDLEENINKIYDYIIS